jgi:hypothetical protein
MDVADLVLAPWPQVNSVREETAIDTQWEFAMPTFTSQASQSWFHRHVFGRRKRLIGGLVLGLIGLPLAASAAPVGTPFNDLPAGSAASRTATEVADAGLMTGFPDGGFHPYQNVSRILLAQTLHRGLPRLSLTRDISAFPTVDDFNERAIVSMLVDGFFRGSQGVLVTLDMEVSTTGVTADCTTHLRVESQPYSFDAGSWDFTFSPGERHRNVSATFMAAQASGTAYTYALFGSTDCPNPITVDNGLMTAQSFAFNGQGNAFEQH